MLNTRSEETNTIVGSYVPRVNPMCVCVCYTYTHTYMCVRAWVRVRLCVRACMCVCARVRVHARARVCALACVCAVYARARARVCMHVCWGSGMLLSPAPQRLTGAPGMNARPSGCVCAGALVRVYTCVFGRAGGDDDCLPSRDTSPHPDSTGTAPSGTPVDSPRT